MEKSNEPGFSSAIFENKDFDPISYINSKFPDEDSLMYLDNEIDCLKKELGSLNNELVTSIQEHALLNEKLQSEINQSTILTKEIINEVSVIKEKATKSEVLVYEMCKDIKSLDTAKKNLTFSITALKKFIMMLTAVDKLSEYCEFRKYKEVSHLLSAFTELSSYFKKYENVSQISELYKEKNAIVRELKLQLQEDFVNFGKGKSLLTHENLSEACMVVEALGVSFKNEIVKIVCEEMLKPYQEVFASPENATLENTERRYGWIWRNLKEFDSKYMGIFPKYWGIICHILYEFCCISRLQITQILEKNETHQDVAVLMNALQSTILFENKVQDSMKKEYSEFLKKPDNPEKSKEPINEFKITSLPKFKRTIADSFEPYLRPYVEKEEQELRDNISKSLENDEIDPNSELRVLSSSLFLFNYIKAVINRASGYSRSQTMFDIFRVLKRALKLYKDEMMNRIAVDEKMLRFKDENTFESTVCYRVNTAEYCKDTLGVLASSIQNKLESPFSEKVDLEPEEEMFTNLLNRGIESLLGHIDHKIENEFNVVYKINWEKLELVGDVSEYVKGYKNIMTNHIKNVKNYLSEISELGLQQLQLGKKLNNFFLKDLFEIKMHLNNLGKGDKADRTQSNYTNFVNKTIQKSENILKLLSMPNEKFLENFKIFFEDATQNDYEKILVLKGLRKNDMPPLSKLKSSK